jgi:hypothetical protein
MTDEMIPKTQLTERMQEITAEAAKLYQQSLDSDKRNADRAAKVLTNAHQLLTLGREHPEDFREFKRQHGIGDKRQYNKPEQQAREIIRIVLRHEENRGIITRYSYALSFVDLNAATEPDLPAYIKETGGVVGCYKAWNKFRKEQREPDEADKTTKPEAGEEIETDAPETVSIEIPSEPTLYFVDPEGFAVIVTEPEAATIIRRMMRKSSRADKPRPMENIVNEVRV